MMGARECVSECVLHNREEEGKRRMKNEKRRRKGIGEWKEARKKKARVRSTVV